MSKENQPFKLPAKIDRYLASLSRLYDKDGEVTLRLIVVNSEVSVHEQWDYDNWNGGTYGHAVTLTIPEDLFHNIVKRKDHWQIRLREDINKLDNTQNEHISDVFIEMEMTEEDQWRERSGILRPRLAATSIPRDTLHRIWGEASVRVFLSHKANVKVQTSQLKEQLDQCGIASFVAHEDIDPTEEWQKEIDSALFSMDALVALLTDDFHDSDWTDQEVGVALGRGVPLIAVRLGSDPYGLMGKRQGLGGCGWENISGMAVKIFEVLQKRLPDKSRLFQAALSVYARSSSWAESAWNVSNLLAKFETLSDSQVKQIVKAHDENGQNRSSFEGRKLLLPLLRKWTGELWVIGDNGLEVEGAEARLEDELPF